MRSVDKCLYVVFGGAGAKLCMIADLIATASDAVDNDGIAAANSASIHHALASVKASDSSAPHGPVEASIPRSGFVVGVDVVAHRLAICKTLVCALLYPCCVRELLWA